MEIVICAMMMLSCFRGHDDPIDHYIHRVITLYERYVPLRQRIYYPINKCDLFLYIMSGQDDAGTVTAAQALAILKHCLDQSFDHDSP